MLTAYVLLAGAIAPLTVALIVSFVATRGL